MPHRHELNELNRDIQRIANIGGWQVDLRTGQVEWTEQTYQIHGLAPGFPLNTELVMGLYTPESAERLGACFARAVAEGVSYSEILQIRRPNGELRWVIGQGDVIYDENGQAVIVRGTLQDIDAKKKSEILDERISELRRRFIEKSRSAKDFFEFVLSETLAVTQSEYGFVGEILEDDDGKYLKTYALTDISWNEETADFYQREAPLGLEFRNLDTLFGAVIRDASLMIANDAKNHKYAAGIPHGHPPLDSFLGVPLFVSGKMRAMIGVANRPGGYSEEHFKSLKKFFDTIEQLIGQYQLESRSEAIEKERVLILHGTGIGLWTFYPETNKLLWDQSMYEVYGVDPQDFNGHYDAWKNTLHPHDHDRAIQEFEQALQSSNEFSSLFRVITKTGELRFIKAKAVIERDPQNLGRILKVSGYNTNVTKEVALEEELKRQQSLANHQAKLASIGELAAGVGHEINNPLTIIKGLLEMLLKQHSKGTLSGEKLQKNLNKSLFAVERIAKIVKGLRSFSRKDSVDHELFDLAAASLESVDLLQEIFAAEGIELYTTDFFQAGESISVMGNRGQYQQVLMNLFSNARDALRESATKRIYLRRSYQQGRLRMEFEDTGCGIPEEIRNKVFDPFFTTKEVNQGTGIGLAMVHRFVTDMNGEIEMDSEPGRGTRFVLHFFVKAASATDKLVEDAS